MFPLYSGFGWVLPGARVEDPAEPVSACHPPPSCRRISGQFPRPSQVRPPAVSLLFCCSHFAQLQTLLESQFGPDSGLIRSTPLLQHRPGLLGPVDLMDPRLHRQPEQQRQTGLLWRLSPRTLLQRLSGCLLRADFQTQSDAGGPDEERYSSLYHPYGNRTVNGVLYASVPVPVHSFYTNTRFKYIPAIKDRLFESSTNKLFNNLSSNMFKFYI